MEEQAWRTPKEKYYKLRLFAFRVYTTREDIIDTLIYRKLYNCTYKCLFADVKCKGSKGHQSKHVMSRFYGPLCRWSLLVILHDGY